VEEVGMRGMGEILMTDSKIKKEIASSGRFEGQFRDDNNPIALKWAKEYLDNGFNVVLKSEYVSGWKTLLLIKPNKGVER
jgi:hypothetical protein